jgi:hypothetical protein
MSYIIIIMKFMLTCWGTFAQSCSLFAQHTWETFAQSCSLFAQHTWETFAQ